VRLQLINQIIISRDFDRVINRLKELASDRVELEIFVKKESNFLVKEVDEVIERAYLTSSKKSFLILGAEKFSEVIQNRLLKIIEEPPKNRGFIIITPKKSALLPTIKSRLPIINLEDSKEEIELDLNIENLTVKDIYNFIKSKRGISQQESSKIIEKIIKDVTLSKRLDEETLKLFKDIRVALELGSPPDFLLTTLLLKLTP
jgi:DNA polymerase-3 subunit delta'